MTKIAGFFDTDISDARKKIFESDARKKIFESDARKT